MRAAIFPKCCQRRRDAYRLQTSGSGNDNIWRRSLKLLFLLFDVDTAEDHSDVHVGEVGAESLELVRNLLASGEKEETAAEAEMLFVNVRAQERRHGARRKRRLSLRLGCRKLLLETEWESGDRSRTW